MAELTLHTLIVSHSPNLTICPDPNESLPLRSQRLYPRHTIPFPLHNFTHNPLLFGFLLGTIHILEHLIHLLEALARRLRNEEECEHKSEETENSEESVGAVAGVLNERWGDEALISLVHV